ncbi:class II glutamine amidotransferase [Agrobacterium sp. Azo12]|jgi:glutamine amidotransferase|uniref:class II glutamine amidotransferase n=1 Tax=Agrobacterium sp. Azo12 TaxID=3031129 RepID=UPI0023D8AB98|nr:class II glutamine amidotransferase [Agrobacterium sp. Azo12]MDO5896487.1 class II glutamine amidotransferase [Agrobacterium sp. Azo12]
MCRFLAYSGSPVWLDTLLIEPESSLISQSMAAREAKTVVNGDGCGIGWYGDRKEPGMYKGILPAWSDRNLTSLCHQIQAQMFLAHVRSATTGGVSMANCHPFGLDRHLFMHNGQIGGYEHVKRKVEALIPDDVYAARSGSSDSEAMFLIAAGFGLAADPISAFSRTLLTCLDILRSSNVDQPIRFSAVLANGDTMHAFRWSSDERPPSLYWRRMPDGVAVASEPFGDRDETWELIPADTVATVKGAKISFAPFDPCLADANEELLCKSA